MTVVNGPIDSLTGSTSYTYNFACCTGVDLDSPASVTVVKTPDEELKPGDYRTFTHGGWGAPPNGNNVGQLLATNFALVYPGGSVEVGVVGGLGFSIKLTGPGAVCKFLPATAAPSVLTIDIASSEPCSTGPSSPSTASGEFGGQVVALQLNVDFSAASFGPSGLGALTIVNLATSDELSGTPLTTAQVDALNGQTISQVLAEANTVLGGGAATYGLTVPQLNDLVDLLNKAFDNG